MPLGNPIRKQNESRMVSVLATEGQTVFTVQGGYIINHISVFRNGVRLSPAEDFTAGDGSTVTLNNAANIDDRIDFHIFDRFTVQNAIVGAASSQIISGDLTLTGKLFGELDVPSVNTGIITATELDLNGKGDISGDLNVAGVSTFQAVQGTTGTFSGDVDIADKIVHTGDTNTAIRFPAADTITAETGGSERFRIASDGKVGINQDTPRALLSLGGTIDAQKMLLYDNDGGTNEKYGFGVQSNELRQFAGGSAKLTFGHISSSDGSTYSERLTINSAGQIGIGTVTPNRQVHQHVRSSAANYYQWTNDTTGVSATSGLLVGITAAEEGLVWNYGSTALRFGSGNAERLRIASDGHVKFGDGDPVAVAAVEIENADPVLLLRDTAATSASGDCKYSFGNASHYPVASISHSWDGTNGGLHFYTRLSGTETERLAINSAGVVGINTVGARGATLEVQDIGTTGPCLLLAGATNTEGDIAVPTDQDLNIGHWNNSDTYTGRLQITTVGRVLIGRGAVTAASNLVAQGGLQVSANGASGAPSLCIGADGTGANTQSITDNTDKDARIGFPNYDIQEEPLALISGFVGDGSALTGNEAARIYLGGGTSYMNAVNQIRFYTTSGNQNTVTGDERMRILANGNIHIGGQAGVNNALLHVEKVNAGGDVAIRIHNDTGTDSGSTASLLFTVSPTDNFDAQIFRYYRESNNFVIQYATNNPTMVLTNDNKVRFGGGAHTVDPICGTGGIDIMAMGSSGAFPFVIGADNSSNSVTRSSNTEKQARMGFPTYANSAGTLATFVYLKSDANDHVINIGGGTGWGYAATEVNIYGATNNTTSTGTLLSKFESRGSHGQFWYDTDTSLWNNTDSGSAMNFQGGDSYGSLSLKTDRATNYSNVYLNKTNTGSGSDLRWISFYWNGSSKGYLRYESDDVVLAQDSDYRLKTNIADLTNCIDKVKLLKPVSYNWNGLLDKPTDIVRHGFVAHELAEVIPQAVMGAKDATKTDEDGNENVIDPQQIEQKYIIPTLTKALQEAIAKIETLETKVAALEGS